MNISVVIPIYNAAKYLEKAVNSVIIQKHECEIILVEDKSTDNSLEICKELSSKYVFIKIIANTKNLGVAACRNQGIYACKREYIAFLDSDDYYLPGFFDIAEKHFSNNTDAGAVFGSLGVHYYDEESKKKHLLRNERDRTGLNYTYNPKMGNLFSLLHQEGSGHFSLIGSVFKLSAILKTGIFDTGLVQSEDTDFIWRFCLKNTLYGIDINIPVAIRGVHEHNSVFNQKESEVYKLRLLSKWLKEIIHYDLSGKDSRMIIRKYLELSKRFRKRIFSKPESWLYKVYLLIKLLISNPKLIKYLIK